MTTFQDKLLTKTDCDEAGDYVMPNLLSPRDLVFRPDIGHKLYHHQNHLMGLQLFSGIAFWDFNFEMFSAIPAVSSSDSTCLYISLCYML